MSENAMKWLEQIFGENADKLDEKGKGFVEGYYTRAVQEATAQTTKTDSKEAE